MIYDKVFHNLSGGAEWPDTEFEQCVFRACDFAEADFSDFDFADCVFDRCRLVITKFERTGMRNSVFDTSEVRGVDFGLCRKFGFTVAFRSCHLSFCSFHELKMPKIPFSGSALIECFFSECDLTRADFSDCNLERTLFDRCNLERADFRTAVGYTIDPAANRMRGARFAREGVEGLLAQYGIEIEE